MMRIGTLLTAVHCGFHAEAPAQDVDYTSGIAASRS
jgi:hypothetical protein